MNEAMSLVVDASQQSHATQSRGTSQESDATWRGVGRCRTGGVTGGGGHTRQSRRAKRARPSGLHCPQQNRQSMQRWGHRGSHAAKNAGAARKAGAATWALAIVARRGQRAA